MPEYRILITRTAQKQLDKLPDSVVKIIAEAIKGLTKNPRPAGCQKLKGRDGYRIRKGDYRIIYDIYDRQITVEIVAIGHRREIYE